MKTSNSYHDTQHVGYQLWFSEASGTDRDHVEYLLCRCLRASLHNQFPFNSPAISSPKPETHTPVLFFFLLYMCMPVRNHGELGVFFSLITHINVCNVHLNNRGRQRARTQEEKKRRSGKNMFWPFSLLFVFKYQLGFFPHPL